MIGKLRMLPNILRSGTAPANAVSLRQALMPAEIHSTEIASRALVGDHYAEVRNVLQIPFDDSLDSTGAHYLECFFQMPVDTVKVVSAKVWIQQKPFRAYETSATSYVGSGTSVAGGGSSSGTSSSNGNSAIGGASPSNSGGAGTTTDAQGLHNHTETGSVTSSDGSHSHNVGSHTHTIGHSHSDSGHAHSVTISFPSHSHSVDLAHGHAINYGIYEAAATGTLGIKFSDDGTLGNYSATLQSAFNNLSGYELLPYITNTKGDKRLRIDSTGLCRVQVLVMLDLIVAVPDYSL